LGIILILLSALSFSLSSFFGKIVTNTTNMSGIIISLSRFVVGTIVMFTYIVATRRTFKAPDIKPIISRTVFNSFSIMLYSAALNYTTMTNANMLNMVSPVFVVLLSPYYLKEDVKKNSYIYLFTIMLGTYFVANPKFGSVNKGDLLSLLSSLTAAISIMDLTKARRKNEGYIIVFYVMALGTLINIPFSLDSILNFEASGLFWVIISGVFGVLGQIFFTMGYRYVDAATGALVSTSRIVISALLGVILLGEPLNLNIVLGMLLIGGSLVGLSGFFDRYRKQTE